MADAERRTVRINDWVEECPIAARGTEAAQLPPPEESMKVARARSKLADMRMRLTASLAAASTTQCAAPTTPPVAPAAPVASSASLYPSARSYTNGMALMDRKMSSPPAMPSSGPGIRTSTYRAL